MLNGKSHRCSGKNLLTANSMLAKLSTEEEIKSISCAFFPLT